MALDQTFDTIWPSGRMQTKESCCVSVVGVSKQGLDNVRGKNCPAVAPEKPLKKK